MFQSLTYYNYSANPDDIRYYDLTDSDFGQVRIVVDDTMIQREGPNLGTAVADAGAIITEYRKRKLNAPANLALFFRWFEKTRGVSIANQIQWAIGFQPLFTPELKQQVEKHLILI
jgi:hypothetical protein